MQNPFEHIEQRFDQIEALLTEMIAKLNEPVEKQSDDFNVLFNTNQLATYWQCHRETINQKRRRGELPFIQHGRKVLYRKSEIDALTANKIIKW